MNKKFEEYRKKQIISRAEKVNESLNNIELPSDENHVFVYEEKNGNKIYVNKCVSYLVYGGEDCEEETEMSEAEVKNYLEKCEVKSARPYSRYDADDKVDHDDIVDEDIAKKELYTVGWAYEDESGNPYTGTSVVHAKDAKEAEDIVKRKHPKATYFSLKKGRLYNSGDCEELFGFDDEEAFDDGEVDLNECISNDKLPNLKDNLNESPYDVEKEYEKICDALKNEMRKKELFAEMYVDSSIPAIVGSITWGDWKHDHGRFDYIVNKYLKSIGKKADIFTKITENDGSDCYSADHYIYNIESVSQTNEDIEKLENGKWANVGDDGEKHGEFKTKKEAEKQMKAMYANGFKK